MLRQLSFLLACAALCLAQGDRCDIPNAEKWDCGIVGTNEAMCEADGCCWQPVAAGNGSLKGIPWCYHSTDDKNPCSDIVWSAPDPGFTQEYYDIMYDNYLANLNIDGSGAVVAAPDQETPGGSYYYHWMRDAGLSIKAWLDINDNDYDKVKTELEAYAGWVAKVQHKADPNDIDVRIEPKFTIPDGEPYTGGWCRPQTDGPALRAMAMSKWGMILKNSGNGDPAGVWDIVKFDMAWVTENWEQMGCDLWEEVRSDDFFFNRMAYIYSLNVAADFGDMIGEDASEYRAVAEEIKAATKTHWKDGFLYESTNRPYDGAVLHSIATFGEYLYPPSSNEAAATIGVLARAFCQEYPINQEEIAAGKPGLLIGRYPGDSYAGGNPWQLLTAVTAEVFYLGGQATYKDIEKKGDFSLRYSEYREWIKLLKLGEGSTAKDLARAQIAAGDAVMTSLWSHVQDAGGRVDEQIDKHTGVQASAEGLTWSYANILHALHVRENAGPDPGTTAGPGTTDKPGTTSQPGTTAEPPKSCCDAVKFVSTGQIATKFPELLGKYVETSVDASGRKVFKKLDGDRYLHYSEDLPHKFEAWVFSKGDDDLGSVVNEKARQCADEPGQTWTWLNSDHWEDDISAKVICDGSNVDCCSTISVSSSGGIGSQYPDVIGEYTKTLHYRAGQPVYQKGTQYLYFLDDVPHHFAGWTISTSLTELGPVAKTTKTDCADSDNGDWEFLNASNSWQVDATLAVDCV